jgi:hypothetical protein
MSFVALDGQIKPPRCGRNGPHIANPLTEQPAPTTGLSAGDVLALFLTAMSALQQTLRTPRHSYRYDPYLPASLSPCPGPSHQALTFNIGGSPSTGCARRWSRLPLFIKPDDVATVVDAFKTHKKITIKSIPIDNWVSILEEQDFTVDVIASSNLSIKTLATMLDISDGAAIKLKDFARECMDSLVDVCGCTIGVL